MSIIQGDSLTILRDRFAAESVHCCVTSPPYWGLRDYGIHGQLGLEPTPELYVAKITEVFREVHRVLKADGTLWLNLGDSYAGSGQGWMKDGTVAVGPKQKSNLGSVQRTADTIGFDKPRNYISSRQDNGVKPKDLVGIPWRVAFALQADGWYLRSDIIWSKPNPMPESVTDRPTKAHEYLFLLSKSERYYYDYDAVKEKSICDKPRGGSFLNDTPYSMGAYGRERWKGEREFQPFRNKRTVWEVATMAFNEAHFATFPPKLIEPCILAGCPAGGLVLDPFTGSGTTIVVAQQLGRRGVGIELNPKYIEMAQRRCAQEGLPL